MLEAWCVTDIIDTVATRVSGIGADSPIAAALSLRSDILTMTEQAHDAALKPAVSGGFSHAERAALSCRMARLSGEVGLAAHFMELMSAAGAVADVQRIADPELKHEPDRRLAAILRHTDLVTVRPSAAVAEDIKALAAAGVGEDDIVRLSELAAFVSYQIRLTVGLRLLGASE